MDTTNTINTINELNGYIYVRSHSSYDVHNAYKLGKTTNIYERDAQYATGEIKRGYFKAVFAILNEKIDIVEHKLQIEFNNEFNIYYDAGIEFYDKKIIDLIEPYLNTHDIKYKKLSEQEIENLTGRKRIKKIVEQVNDQTIEQTTEQTINEIINQIIEQITEQTTADQTTADQTTDDQTTDEQTTDEQTTDEQTTNDQTTDDQTTDEQTTDDQTTNNQTTDDQTTDNQITQYIPRNYQTDIIKKSYEYFKQNSKGMLILPCGIGKTLISLWIAIELNLNKIIIGVPNISLLKQWEQNILILFKDTNYTIVSDTVGIDYITQFLTTNSQKCIVITTYSSSYKVYKATTKINFTFDIKINDEVHHLTSSDMKSSHDKKTYVQMLNILSVKQLSLTATLKHIENNNDSNIVSNNSIEHFGNIIEQKSLLWAINENIICDYVVQTIIANDKQLKEQLHNMHITTEHDKKLFLSAYVFLKSIFDKHSHHLLIYSNSKKNSSKIIQYIKMLLNNKYFDISNLYYSTYHGDMKSKTQKEQILNNFNNKKFGIISCVYCLGEGYDNHNIDAVVFAENMSSDIRIVQSSLRASRKNKLEHNKITKIILPILDNNNNWLENNDNTDLKKIKEVIYQLGLEDETVMQKIKAFNINIKKHNYVKNIINNTNCISIEYNEELTQKIKLKTTKRIEFGLTYSQAIKIIANENVQNKEDYYKLCDKNNQLPREPDIAFEKQFSNWIKYLSIKDKFYDLNTCKSKINEYLQLYPEIKTNYLDLQIVCEQLCKIDNLFPPNGLWIKYYGIKQLGDIIVITNNIKKRSIIL